jgi:hypothetical protein
MVFMRYRSYSSSSLLLVDQPTSSSSDHQVARIKVLESDEANHPINKWTKFGLTFSALSISTASTWVLVSMHNSSIM